jgi:hypothetical protein
MAVFAGRAVVVVSGGEDTAVGARGTGRREAVVERRGDGSETG